MPVMQSCVLTFRVRSGAGTQTVTGVQDKDGNAFVPKLIIFHSGSTVLNTLTYNPTSLANTAVLDMGLYRASNDSSAYAAIGDIPQFGGKVSSGAGGANYAVCSLQAQGGGGGSIYRKGDVTAVRSGEFDIEITSEIAPATTTDMMVTVLGGDTFEIDTITSGCNNGTHTTTGGLQPKAVWMFPNMPSASGTVSTAAGGTNGIGWGWDTPNGGPGAAHILIGSLAANWRFQSTAAMNIGIDNTTHLETGAPYVSAWNANGITTAGYVNGVRKEVIAFGGTGVLGASGAITQPLATGHQTFDVGIKAKWLMLVSIGAPSSGSVRSDWASLTTGWFDGVNQSSYYCGEEASGQPLTGARFLSDSTVLRFAQPAGASTSFTSVAEAVSMDGYGTVTLNWTAVSGDANQILWFALGEAPDVAGSMDLTIEPLVSMALEGPLSTCVRRPETSDVTIPTYPSASFDICS